jgi:chaperone BCS1
MEDIDSLFDANRKKEVGNSPLTFSGLLNALDGVGGAEGQLVFMTTNFKDRLDSALIRKGRVDIQVEFGYASEWQMEEYFRQFYPKAPSGMASEFATRLRKELDCHKLEISTASLQHFFVVHRFSEAEDALTEVSDIREELNLRDKEDKPGEAFKSLEKNSSTTGTSPKAPWSIFNLFRSKL